MSDERPRVEWTKRASFAQVAEALGVDTDHIMAVQNELVLYTPKLDAGADSQVWAAELERDDAGVLRVASREPLDKTVRDYLPPLP